MNKRERIQEDLDYKLKFEGKLATKLNRVFGDIRDNLNTQIRNYAIAIDTQTWRDLFYDTFMEHYQEVSRHFSRNQERQYNIRVTDEERSAIDNALMLFFLSSAQEAADGATRTTLRNAQDSMIKAQEQARVDREDGQVVEQVTIAAMVDALMKKKQGGRVKNIKVTETQKAAEASKFTEAQVLQTGTTNINTPNAFIPTAPDLVKDWVGILDDVIRDTHRVADRTQKGIPQGNFFVVGGYNMMFPADRRYGAPAKEVCNCRCVAYYPMTQDQIKARQ